MAFEYLMARYMLKRQLSKLVQNLERLHDFDYRQLPTHYEEAILIYISGTKKPLNLKGFQPNPNKRQQFKDFLGILSRYGGDKKAAANELAKKFRNTYFYYYVYPPPDLNK